MSSKTLNRRGKGPQKASKPITTPKPVAAKPKACKKKGGGLCSMLLSGLLFSAALFAIFLYVDPEVNTSSFPTLSKAAFDADFNSLPYTKTKLSNGITLSFIDVSESQDESQPVIVFLHGFPQSAKIWRKSITYFSKLGFRAIAPDLRGYNNSDAPAGRSSYSVSNLSEDVELLIREYVKPKNDQSVTVVGHDWGGVLSWKLSFSKSSRANNIIVVNAPHPEAILKSFVTSNQLLKSWYMFFFQVPFVPEFKLTKGDFAALRHPFSLSPTGTYSQNEINEYVKMWDSSIETMVNWYRGSLLNQFTNLVQGIKHDTQNVKRSLLIWAEEDKYLGKHLAEASIKYCDDIEVHYIRGAGHFVVDEQNSAVNSAIKKFLSKEISSLKKSDDSAAKRQAEAEAEAAAAKKQAEAEAAAAKKQAEAAAKKQADAEAAKKAEAEAAAAAKKQAEAEAAAKAEAAKKAEAAAAAKKQAEAEAAAKAEAAKKAEAEAAAKKVEAEAAAKKVEAEAAAKKVEAEAAAKKVEAEAAAKKQADAEAAAKKQADAEAAKKAEAEAAAKKQQEEAAKKAEAEVAAKKQQEEAAKKVEAEAAAKKQADAEAAKKAEAEAAAKKAEAEAAAKKAETEAAAKKQAEAEAAAKKQAEEKAALAAKRQAAAAKKQADEAEAAAKKQAEDEKKRKVEEASAEYFEQKEL